MPGRIAEVAAISAFALGLTLAIAAPVLRAPSERVFGMELVGRHHDPFTVMRQFDRPVRAGVYTQPITDITGALLARGVGAVAAYNWLILLTFPLSAAAAYLLARYLALSRTGAAVAAMAYAFSPFHLAQAAYHPHIAQTQWVPLYFLALWGCLDHPSPRAVGLLGAATMAVTLSNFYGGLIAAAMTPVAVAAYWLVRCRTDSGSRRRLGITVATLLLIATCGIAYASYSAGAVVADPTAFAFPRADLFRYSATAWSYLIPPVEHPLTGAAAQRFWAAAGVREGLLEQQVSLGWGILALGLIAVMRWPIRDRQPSSLARVPILVVVAAAAFACSLSPERTIGTFTFLMPSGLLYELVPMFRSYARFGVVVQLMAALLAGIGVESLRRSASRRARIACVALVVLAAAEYAVSPSALWRDVLPTKAHRWAMQQTGVRVLDCTPLDPESESVPWLSGSRVTLLGGPIDDCADANLAPKLAAAGFTHLLVRRDAVRRSPAAHGVPEGLRLAASFEDAQVFAVMPRAPIYTAAMTGFFPRERDVAWTWRWMGAEGGWTIVNTSARPVVATLGVELSAFHHARRVELRLDDRPVQTLVVDPSRRIHLVGPLTVLPGDHALVFHAIEAPTVAGGVMDNGDWRSLSLALGTWTWSTRGEQP